MRLSNSRAALVFLSGTLAFTGVACSTDKSATDAPDNAQPVATQIAPSTAPVIIKLPTPPALSQPNSYELALDKAYSAFIISQSAQSSDDWNLVVSQWTDALKLMKALPVSSPYKAIARKKIAEYQRNLTYAQQQVTRPIQEIPDSVVVTPSPLMPPAPTVAVEAPLGTLQPFQATIKRRAGGTPVINVTFNNTQQIEMIVDTGASGTVITQQTAAALGVLPVGKAKADTASARDVEFSVGYVDSIEVGGAVIKNVPVAIAPSPELEVGLLGHDFFGDYDVTIKRDLVEFRPR